MELTKQHRRLIGYARVSTDDQDCETQRIALRKYGCQTIYSDMISGTKLYRPELEIALNSIRPGDALVVVRLDRLGRNMMHSCQIIATVEKKGGAVVSLNDNFDTSTPSGALMRDLILRFAQYERDLIVERTKAGLQRALLNGWKPGCDAMRRKDPVAIAKMLASRSTTLDLRAKITSAPWIDIIRTHRPTQPWPVVLNLINHDHYVKTNKLSLSRLRQICSRLVRMGDLPPSILGRSAMPTNQGDVAKVVARSLKQNTPDISLRAIGDELMKRGLRPVRAQSWSAQTIKDLLRDV